VTYIFERLRAVAHWQFGWLALLAALALTGMGIEAIETTDLADGNAGGYAHRQTIWLGLCLAAFGISLLPHPRQIARASYFLYVVTLMLLLLLVVPGMPESIVPVRNGARSWINLRVMNFQPSELAKITSVLALAWFLRYRSSHRAVRGLLVPFLMIFVPTMLILRQPDLGTAILFGPALVAMLVAAGAKLRHLGGVVLLALVAVAANVFIVLALPDALQVLKPHQRARIKATVSQARGQHRYDSSINYQQRKAVVLVGAGRVHGYGADRSATMLRFNHLPHHHNDMIYAVMVNRWGFVGGAAVICLFSVIVLAILVLAWRSKEPFVRLILVGFGTMFFTQAMLNVAITLGMMPVTGITLPFVSYGGSSLLATFGMLGLAVNFGGQRVALLTRPSFEYDERDAATA
jgi:cell division protein FtsW (lipid II flippase)